MQYLRRLHSCLTLFNLQNDAAPLRNKTTQSQSYYILFCEVKCPNVQILLMKHHHFCSSYFIRGRTALKAQENRVRLCKPFKEPRNRFPAWRAGTTNLFALPARLAESIPGVLKRLQIRAQFILTLKTYFYI